MDKIIAIVFVLVIVSFSSCTAVISHNDNAAMNEMVAKGVDPIAARCAVKDSNGKMCIIYAAKMKETPIAKTN